MLKKLIVAGVLLACSTAGAAQTAPAAPAATDDVLQKAINLPGTNWSIYGAGQKSKLGKTVGVPGEQAMRVQVTAKGANAWDVGALSPIQKPIAADDAILVAAYLRAPELKEGETTTIAFLGATEAAEPYGNIAATSMPITNQWKLYYASGKAPRAFTANQARVTVHLANAKQVIELGPVFVLDFGAKQDVAKLPKN